MSEKPDFYEDDTWDAYEAYEAGGTAEQDITPDGKLRVTITLDNKKLVLVQDPMHEYVSLKLFEGQQQDENMGQYAQRLYMNQSEFSKWTAILNPQKMPWETLLHVMLLMPKLPTPKKADHLFMELALPGLLTNTCDLEANKRNYVIRRFFEYAADLQEETPQRECIALLQHALLDCGLKLTIRKSRQTQVLEAETPTGEERELFAGWKAELDKLSARDYGKFRQSLLGRYMQHNRLSEIGVAVEQIQTDLNDRFPRENGKPYDIERVTRFFHSMDSKQRNKGKREMIIHIGIVMSCRMKDINQMLREANCAYLYPHSRDPKELALIEKIVANPNYI